jgi:hypothetical protein
MVWPSRPPAKNTIPGLGSMHIKGKHAEVGMLIDCLPDAVIVPE